MEIQLANSSFAGRIPRHMDGHTSTLRPSYGDPRSGPSPSPIITVVVLVTGVAGGLILVIAVILFCKYCIKRKKVLKRQPALFRRRASGARNGADRSYKQYSHYESVHCDKAQGPETSREAITKSVLKITRNDGSGHDEESSIDIAVARYKESLGRDDDPENPDKSKPRWDSDVGGDNPTLGGSSEVADSRHHRRVSLLLHGLQHYPNSNAPGVPSSYSKHRYQRRHTEGDYLQLKSSQRSERPPKLRRQSSGSAPTREYGSKSRFEGPPGARIEDPRSSSPSNGGGLERFAEVPSSRGMGAQDSPSPPSNKPYRTEVSVEVHRDPSSGSGGSKGDLTNSRTSSPPKCQSKNGSPHCGGKSNNSHCRESGPHPSTSHGLPRASSSGSPRASFSRTSLRGPSSSRSGHNGSSHGPTTRSLSGPAYAGSPGIARTNSIHTSSPPRIVRVPNSRKNSVSQPGPSSGASPSGRGRGDHLHHPRPQARHHARSLETDCPRTESPRPGSSRRVRSCDDTADYDDYDRFEITQFQPSSVYSADHGMLHAGDDLPGELRSKVRYNDMGSLEEVSQVPVRTNVQPGQIVAAPDIPVESSDDTETLNGAHKYRELWNLRATLEDEEDFSDTIRMEDMLSPSESEQQSEPATTSVNTSFESTNTEPGSSDRRRREEHMLRMASANLLHPNYENRRHAYRSLLNRKLRRPQGGQPGSTDNSFDSVDTDGNQSDSSRPEVTTTSFESTTTNTSNSTNEAAPHRLQQMRGDSGYKSLETQNTLPSTPPRSGKKSIHFALEPEVGDSPTAMTPSPDDGAHRGLPGGSGGDRGGAAGHKSDLPRNHMMGQFERNRAKTASKKRRDFGRERQVVQVYESVCEGETDSRSDAPSGDSFDEAQAQGKLSMFSKIFKSHSRERKPHPSSLTRDWSIDERTNAIFREFNRYDPKLDPKSKYAVRRPGFHSRQRLNRKHSESFQSEYDPRRREKLRPELRSLSLGSDSSTSSVRRISPQDSIEEEEHASPAAGAHPRVHHALPARRASWNPEGSRSQVGPAPRRPSAAPVMRDIPIIKLPEDDPPPPV